MEFYIETDRVHFLIDAEVYCDFCPGDNVTPPGGDFEITSWKPIDISYKDDDIDTATAVDYINDLTHLQFHILRSMRTLQRDGFRQQVLR